MNVTAHMIEEMLAPYAPHMALAQSAAPVFTAAALLPAHNGGLAPDVVWIGTRERLLAHADRLTQAHLAVCVDGDVALPCGVIALHGDIADVSNCLVALFARMAAWEALLDTVAARRGSIQEFMDVSEPYFDNPVVAINTSLTPIAYTRDIPWKHPDLETLARTGRFTERMVAGIAQQNILPKSERYKEIGFYYPPNYTGYTLIVRAYHPNPMRLNLVCQYGVNREPTQGDLDMLRFFTDYLGDYIATAAGDATPAGQRDISFLIDILEGNADRRELESKASLISLPFLADYRLYCIGFEIDIPSRANYLVAELGWKLPFTTAFLYEGQVLLLVDEHNSAASGESAVAEQMEPLLRSHGAQCGLSSRFSDILDVKSAYVQAQTAIKLGRLLDPELTFYHYYRYFIYHMLMCGSRELPWDQLYDNRLDILIDSDRERGADNMKLLETYLKSDRNITATAREMHLHRNSVLYRLERIEQILGTSFEDPDERLRILLSFKALEFRRAIQREGE